jgi:ComF family protein
MAEADCPYCKGRGFYPYQHIATLGVFDDALKELIHAMKYHRRWNIGEELAERLVGLPSVKALLRDAEIIIPVPLWRWRQVRRGYNQADVIAAHLATQCGAKASSVVSRTRSTESQTQFRSGQHRVENVRGAFRLIKPTAVKDKHVVVVDDVMTSGATLKEVGRMILQGEPRSLCAIALAVADPRGRGFTAI